MKDQRLLHILSREYPTVSQTAAEIINLNAHLSLPKGTEYFFSDIHGEYRAFEHLLNSASGVIRNKIDILFENTMQEADRQALADLIYYPEEHMKHVHEEQLNFDEWFRVTVFRLLEVIKITAEKFTREHMLDNAPADYRNVINELLHFQYDSNTQYYAKTIRSVLDTGTADELIFGMCRMIKNNSVNMLHIIGDIFDRGAHPDRVMDELMSFKDVDIEWGNHDIKWIGAACGSTVCVAEVVSAAIKYNNFDLLEDGYGINLRPLSAFAARVYGEDPCQCFMPHLLDANVYDVVDATQAAKMHKAMAIIRFKLEGQLYERHPEYGMLDRAMLRRVDFSDYTIEIDGKRWALLDHNFPTVDPADPLRLTEEEEELIRVLTASFRHSERLQKHIRYIYAKGSMYKKVNGNLLYHGCIPMTPDGEFVGFTYEGQVYSGRSGMDLINGIIKDALFSRRHFDEESSGRDFIWYLWCGPCSPLFGKSKMATFESTFIKDKAVCHEEMNPYYTFVEDEKVCFKILREFGMDPMTSHIVNGHVPVKAGENPVKGNGRLFMIDGGISKAYQSKTGIGGYTLIYNSHCLALAEHKPYNAETKDTSPTVHIVQNMSKRVLVEDTDKGAEMREMMESLKALMEQYRSGAMKERYE